MKPLCIIFTSILLFSSCDQNDKDNTEAAVITDSTKTDSAVVTIDGHYFWSAEVGGKDGLVMKRTSPIPTDSLNTIAVVNSLNELYPEVKVAVNRTISDTVFVSISNSKYLTQQMGSSGAEAFLAELTYNLTEIPNVNFVSIKFKEGDHATPGTYSRTDFVH